MRSIDENSTRSNADIDGAAFQNTKDVKIMVNDNQDRIIEAHSYALLPIPYFKKIFATERFRQSPTEPIQIKDVNPDAIETIINSVYSRSNIELTEENVLGLLKAAKVLETINIITKCQEFITSCIIADFKGTSQKDYFLGLNIQSLKNVLPIDELNENAMSILNCIMTWVKHDYAERKDYLAGLLDFFDMIDLTPTQINHFLFHEEHGKKGIGHKYPLLAYDLHSWLYQATKKLIVIAKHPTKSTSIVEYDLKNHTWSIVREEEFGKFYQVIVYNDKLYKFGGRRTKTKSIKMSEMSIMDSKTVQIYNIYTKIKTNKTLMSTARKECGAVFLKNFLYACGGYNENNVIINTVERYSLKSGKWEKISSMKEKRCTPAIIAFGDHIYVIGGVGRGTGSEDVYLDTVEVYDCKTNEWSILEERMPTKRSTCAAVAFRGKIYVCGGWNGKTLNVVEMFDIKHKRWKAVKHMNKKREQFLVVEMRGKLYAIGGCSKDNKNAKHDCSVEMYNPCKDEWSYVNTKCPLKSQPMYFTGGIMNKRK